MYGVVSADPLPISTPPTWRGFFCLTSAEGAGLLFCPTAIQPRTSVYSAFCAVNANYTTNATKQRTWPYKRFSCDLPHSTAYNTRPIQAAIIPPAPRWSVSQRPDALNRYQIPPLRRTLCSSAQPPYYNKVYKGAEVRRLLWIHARQCNIPQTTPARLGQFLPSADRWQVLHPAQLLRGQRLPLYRASLALSTRRGNPAAEARRAVRNHWRLPPYLFSGFRPIANRGQQQS